MLWTSDTARHVTESVCPYNGYAEKLCECYSECVCVGHYTLDVTVKSLEQNNMQTNEPV